ncbi:MAG: MarR family transcriptional regulator [Bacteroidetes bacterium]|nr:MAG: MarR family transcriptional regulator [Bacteroidota bacterium]
MKIEEELKTTNFTNERHKAVLSVLFTASWLENYINTHLKAFDLSHQQYNILRILKGSHPKALSVIDIKARMIDRMSNVSRLIEKLRQKDLVTRQEDSQDRRLVQIALTPHAFVVIEEIAKKIPQQDFTENLSIEEAKQLVELLDKLRG